MYRPVFEFFLHIAQVTQHLIPQDLCALGLIAVNKSQYPVLRGFLQNIGYYPAMSRSSNDNDFFQKNDLSCFQSSAQGPDLTLSRIPRPETMACWILVGFAALYSPLLNTGLSRSFVQVIPICYSYKRKYAFPQLNKY